MAVTGAVVDAHALLEAIWTALVAGVGILVAFAFAVLGITRAQEARDRRDVAAVGRYGVLGAVGLAALATGIAAGGS